MSAADGDDEVDSIDEDLAALLVVDDDDDDDEDAEEVMSSEVEAMEAKLIGGCPCFILSST